MKPRPEIIGEKVELLGLFKDVSPEEMDSVRVQALKHFESAASDAAEEENVETDPVLPDFTRQRPMWLDAMAIAAGIGIMVLIPLALLHRAPAVFKDATGSRNIQFGEVVHANDSAGSTLVLADTSRVEMRSQAEFSIERATDGVRIHLRKGSLIVHAAKQHAGHLYVQTRDVIVSVVGTVFLVNAEEEGSRVAVIEGEVHVKQGATETKLGPGEQMTSNPKMELISVKDELAWSSQAVTHMALLEQAATTPAVKAPRFEVASIRPSGPAAPVAPGARGGDAGANSHPTKEGCVPDSAGYAQQLDPGRLAITRATLFQLVGYAYTVQGVPDIHHPNVNCGLLSKTGLLSGGSEWLKTDMWDLEAVIPEGSFSSTPMLTDPKIQQMLQTTLRERFKLVMRRETRDVPVYLLKVGKNGPKFNGHGELYERAMILDSDGKLRRASELPPPPEGQINIVGGRTTVSFGAQNVSMSYWAQTLFGLDNRPVLDRTGLPGRYDFHYTTSAAAGMGNADPWSIGREVVKEMGLELEESRARFDVWVIERAEKPTEN